MMYSVAIRQPDDPTEFRMAARRLLAAEVDPSHVAWTDGTESTLFADELPSGEHVVFVPRAFVSLLEQVTCFRDPSRWSLLYQALWRIQRNERFLLDIASDPLTHRLRRMAAAVKHDQHRMTAFVRFRRAQDDLGDCFIAWYQPQHRVLRRTASFFIDRFANMRFAILTQDVTLRWDRCHATFGPPLSREDAPSSDAIETWWQHYYSATFNPARVNPQLMKSHMPQRFWRDLPETSAIPNLLAAAPARVNRMVEAASVES